MSENKTVVLLVEDEMAHAEIVRRNFENFTIPNTLIHVDNGQSALDYLYHKGEFQDPEASPRPVVVLLDLRLPRVDGLEVLKAIKGDPALCSLPVVILSTSESEHDIKQAYLHHANSYLVKPFEFSEFTKTMQCFGDYWLSRNIRPL